MDRLNLNNNFHDADDGGPRDPEISLGAATILGIFLGLTLVCALFFGLGYSMGRRSTQAVVVAAPEPNTAESKPANKPASGSLGSSVPFTTSPPAATATPAADPGSSNATIPLTPSSNQNPQKPTPPPTIPTGNFIVQIAAVSHREDAESLINALEQRGYTVFIRNEPQDKLLHVQVGPFPNRRDADAMRQHLLYDGYNAIVK